MHLLCAKFHSPMNVHRGYWIRVNSIFSLRSLESGPIRHSNSRWWKADLSLMNHIKIYARVVSLSSQSYSSVKYRNRLMSCIYGNNIPQPYSSSQLLNRFFSVWKLICWDQFQISYLNDKRRKCFLFFWMSRYCEVLAPYEQILIIISV